MQARRVEPFPRSLGCRLLLFVLLMSRVSQGKELPIQRGANSALRTPGDYFLRSEDGRRKATPCDSLSGFLAGRMGVGKEE